ncbi:Por secretion system C-terminal sorting domain-containing protein [Lishizhenia tianjinensis]|uniref:Por secretion system C-terminal sorting domain-containing protein n=1 Tax=Lishizhenia tianjinensis TaxID=477690 RepID=A0A1I6XCW4_9FLAO|nr:T9SS type A sorting domain-containing protein [Lishizhenia tianjinensis]SFT35902.1 Por secretion system C-terminal sorting domain-containing protein [Lishizhenia tianjinensis]
MKTLKNIITAVALLISTLSMAHPNSLHFGQDTDTNITITEGESFMMGDWLIEATEGDVDIAIRTWGVNLTKTQLGAFVMTYKGDSLEGININLNDIEMYDDDNDYVVGYYSEINNDGEFTMIFDNSSVVYRLSYIDFGENSYLTTEDETIEDIFNITLTNFNIQITSNSFEDYTYAVYSMNGQIIETNTVNQNITVDMNGRNGIFVVVIIKGNEKTSKKIYS